MILQSLDIEVPLAQEGEIIKRILADNLVTLRCQDAMVQAFVVGVVQGLHPLEKASLIKRLGIPPKKPGALWILYDTTQATEHSSPFSFGLKATCTRCKQDRFFESPRPHWEKKEFKNGNQISHSMVLVAVSRDDCKRALEGAVWKHCGIRDNPSEDLLIGFDLRMRDIVGLEEEPKAKTNQP